MEKIKVGIIGPGNIGQDLLAKIGRSELLEVVCVVDIRESENLKRIAAQGVDVSSAGIDYMLEKYKGVIQIAFDCTSARAHLSAAPKLKEAGIFAIDLTPDRKSVV